jgi:hypothetical protein
VQEVRHQLPRINKRVYVRQTEHTHLFTLSGEVHKMKTQLGDLAIFSPKQIPTKFGITGSTCSYGFYRDNVVILFNYGSTAFVGPWPLFQFLNLYTVGRTLWTGDQPFARPLPTHKTTQTQNTRRETSMPRVGFELTILVFERAKTFHALDPGGHCARQCSHYCK